MYRPLFIILVWVAAALAARPAGSEAMNAMQRIELEPVQGSMGVKLRCPAFPEGAFTLTAPETIGDTQEMLLNFPDLKPQWIGPDATGAVGYALANGKIECEVRVIPFCDHVDVWQRVTNLTTRTWRHVYAFTCLNPEPVADLPYERSYIATAAGPTRVADIPLTSSPRPLQFYMLRGKKYAGHSFLDGFKATCQTRASDSWIATMTPDGRRVVGVAAADAAFLFTNSEFGCIHSAPDFGDVAPGETRWALTRVYAMLCDLPTFIARQARDRQGGVPSLRPTLRDPKALALQSAEIWLPWADGGHVTLRLPETLNSNLGLLFIDHDRTDMPPVVRVEALPDWHCDPATGELWYRLELPNQVTFGGHVTPVRDGADIQFAVSNGTAASLNRLRPQFCLMQQGAPPFVQGDLSHTYMRRDEHWLRLSQTTYSPGTWAGQPWIWIIASVKQESAAGAEAKPPDRPAASPPAKNEGPGPSRCNEVADDPLIATTDAQGARVVAITWDGGRNLMSNGAIPCLHADPAIADAAAGRDRPRALPRLHDDRRPGRPVANVSGVTQFPLTGAGSALCDKPYAGGQCHVRASRRAAAAPGEVRCPPLQSMGAPGCGPGQSPAPTAALCLR